MFSKKTYFFLHKLLISGEKDDTFSYSAICVQNPVPKVSVRYGKEAKYIVQVFLRQIYVIDKKKSKYHHLQKLYLKVDIFLFCFFKCFFFFLFKKTVYKIFVIALTSCLPTFYESKISPFNNHLLRKKETILHKVLQK